MGLLVYFKIDSQKLKLNYFIKKTFYINKRKKFLLNKFQIIYEKKNYNQIYYIIYISKK